jgi:hypothetical protein
MLDVSGTAIRKAVARGRLKDSVARDDDGTPYVRDAALARREWEQNRSRLRSSGRANDRLGRTVKPTAAPPLILRLGTISAETAIGGFHEGDIIVAFSAQDSTDIILGSVLRPDAALDVAEEIRRLASLKP